MGPRLLSLDWDIACAIGTSISTVLGGKVMSVTAGYYIYNKNYEILNPSVVTTKKVSSLEANPSYGGVQLSWENPNQEDYAGTLVVSRADRYPVSPTDGNLVYWYNGTYCNVAVPNGQKTYFGVFSHNTSYSFSSGNVCIGYPEFLPEYKPG